VLENNTNYDVSVLCTNVLRRLILRNFIPRDEFIAMDMKVINLKPSANRNLTLAPAT